MMNFHEYSLLIDNAKHFFVFPQKPCGVDRLITSSLLLRIRRGRFRCEPSAGGLSLRVVFGLWCLCPALIALVTTIKLALRRRNTLTQSRARGTAKLTLLLFSRTRRSCHARAVFTEEMKNGNGRDERKRCDDGLVGNNTTEKRKKIDVSTTTTKRLLFRLLVFRFQGEKLCTQNA